MNALQSLIGFLGRALLSIIFISSAVFKIFDWQSTEQYLIQALTDCLSLSIGFDMLQHLLEWGLTNSFLLLVTAVAFELVGGLMVFLGLWTRLGALLLFLFMIPATLIFHHFWELEGPDRMVQMTMFMKNISICGGLLILMAHARSCKSDHQHDKAT
jgi:putative oxidoreductase